MSLIINRIKSKLEGEKSKYNKSTIFLLPMLKECKKFLDTKNMSFLVNVYFHTEEDLSYNKHYKDRIYCVFNNVPEFNNEQNFNKLKQMNNYLGNNIVDNYIILIFKIPYTYLADYLLFKKGKYSRISDRYKKMLLEYYPNYSNYIKSILYPTEQDRKQLSLFLGTREKINEVYSSPNPEDEIFKLSSFWKIKY